MTRLRLVLLDANVVIYLFQLGIWKRVTEQYEIVLARTVVDEVQFFETEAGREYVDWEHWITGNHIRIETLAPAEVQAYCGQFSGEYYERLDPGEAESLALLDRDAESQICSADKIVWRVLGNINATERGVSLEEVLDRTGLTKGLPDRFTRAFKEKWCNTGSVERIMGRGRSG